MKKNIGSADKVIRLIIALVALILYFSGVNTGIIGIILIVFAVILILTSFIGSCPLYLPLGLNTIRKNLKG